MLTALTALAFALLIAFAKTGFVVVGLLENALSNTLQFIKQESTNDSYTSEEKREMKKDAVEFRNLQAKLAHFLKGVVSVK